MKEHMYKVVKSYRQKRDSKRNEISHEWRERKPNTNPSKERRKQTNKWKLTKQKSNWINRWKRKLNKRLRIRNIIQQVNNK
jgi:hypothetical protein